jgi:hypothetical protein
LPNIKINTCDKDWFGRDYVFYDKNGNPINILYDETLKQYKGKLYLPENSSDTFRTLELNTFERIRGFEYQQYYDGQGITASYDELKTEKFQLFNTEGIEFVGNTFSVSVTKIEAVNNRNDFYSKWVFGNQADLLFPLGSEIKFSNPIFGINNEETYTVVSTKKNAILIITNEDNLSFNNNIGGLINDSSQYTNLTISGINAIKIYNYVDSSFANNFPSWSEPNFYNFIFKNQKISVVNSENNDGVYTLVNKSLGDNYYSDFKLLVDDLDGDMVIKVINKTSNFNLYTGNIVFADNVIKLSSSVPSLLKPGVKFNIPSSLNNKTFEVSPILNFNSINYYYSDGGTTSNADQVLFQNEIYECVQSYTQSATSSISPTYSDYWKLSTYIPVLQSITNETITNGDIFSLNNEIDLAYIYNATQSSRVNLATAFELHRDSLNILGLEPYLDPLGQFGVLKSKYPTNYVDVEFYIDKIDTFSGSITNGTNFSPTGYTFSYAPSSTDIVLKVNGNKTSLSEDYLSSSAFAYLSTGSASSTLFENLTANDALFWKEVNAGFGLTAGTVVTLEYTTEVSIKQDTIERIIEVEENLVNEVNEDYSKRPERYIVVTDIDEYGLVVTINGQVYSIESTLIYRSNGELDLEESIDKTLREWVEKWRIDLDKRGIFVVTRKYGNNNNTVLHNAIFLRGVYANVQLNISAKVGTTADFNFPDKTVIFYQMGDENSILNIQINNRAYTQAVGTNISTTLTNWVSTNSEVLESFGVYVEAKNQVLYFTKKESIDIDLEINVGRTYLPGEKVFEVIEDWVQNEGIVISSNKIVQTNTDVDFEEECFSTGQIISLNNSPWVLNNQEYNILYLDPSRMILSYQGPFWGTLNNDIQNGFFNLGFGDDLDIGDYILAIVDNNTFTGSVTKVGETYYQFQSGNSVLTVERNNAFGFDENAINISIPEEDEIVITSISTDTNISDIDYFYTNDRISITSDDQINFVDAGDLRVSSMIGITESSIKQVVNPVNNYLFILSDSFVYVVDPITEELKQTISNIGTGWDIECDWKNGDIYVSYSDSDRIMKIDSSLTTTSVDYKSSYFYGKLKYNYDDNSLYVFSRQNSNIGVTSSKSIYRVDLDNTNVIDSSFEISGTESIYIGAGTGSSVSTDDFLGASNSYNKGTLHYNEFNGSLYVSNNGTLHKVDKSNETLIDLNIPTNTYYSIALDAFNKLFWVSSANNRLYAIDENDNIKYNVDIDTYGYIMVNPYDSHIYLATQDGTDSIKIFSTYLRLIFYTISLDYELDKIIFNYENSSIIGYNESNQNVLDILTNFVYVTFKGFSNAFQLSSFVSNQPISGEEPSDDLNTLPLDENQYGTLEDSYTPSSFLMIKSREFIRKPRKNYSTNGSPQAKWVYNWENDNIDELFIVDITGEHLTISGSYAYTGEKPLNNPVLKRTENKDINLVGKSYAQKTIFDILTYSLEYNDSSNDVSFKPEPIQTVIGFNSKNEGVVNNNLLITEYEDIVVTIPSYESFTSSTFSVTLPQQGLSFSMNSDGNGVISFTENSTDTFGETINLNTFVSTNTNLKEGQILKINLTDNINSTPYISNNDNMSVEIVKIFERSMIVNMIDRDFEEESTIKSYPTSSDTTYLDLTLTVMPKTMVKLEIYGQTEIEDVRYKTELRNTGKLINPEDVFIFKEYDINEGGIDWTYMNRKRKEMLDVRNDIYNYIGSYKSIINAINYFGYNDLELYEYFKNINEDSPLFNKLTKVEIPDIFDNSVNGWTENYKFYQFPNSNFEGTNLFNLTYKLTDFDGNSVITYSIEEVIIKLRGLKKWLEKNVVPLTHKILDITGRFDFRKDNSVYHTNSAVTVRNITDKISPVDYNINDIYALPVKSGSTTYNCVVDFVLGSTVSKPDYYHLTVKTYKTYNEWSPFISYDFGDKVLYEGKLYENVLTDTTSSLLNQTTTAKNTNNNPTFYENSDTWDSSTSYVSGNIVKYNRRYFNYSLKTQTVNYLPWVGATGSCLVGTPSTTNSIDDNFYTDLVDYINNEPNTRSYWGVTESNWASDLDVLDIVKTNYPNSWCDLLDRDATLINNIAIDLINLPSNSFQGTKPSTIAEATNNINQMIDDYNLTKANYKFKFKSYNPIKNILLDNDDFILWDDITEWVEIDLEQVQNITEYRSIDNLLPFNFTIDSSIDPYVVLECRSENGYGQIKNIKKAYEVKFDADSADILITTPR